MTNGVATPNACGLGFTMLSEYCVAIAAVSLARGRHGEKGALKSCVSAPCAKIAVEPSTANQLQRRRASLDDSARDLCGQCSAILPRRKLAPTVQRIVRCTNRLL